MRKLSLFLVVVMLVIVFTAGCVQKADAPTDEANASQQEDVIKIGVFEPLTGANAAGGALEKEGLELANELYPEVLGKKVKLVFVDNKSDKVEAANAATKLIDQEKVSLIIGSWGSGFSISAGEVIKKSDRKVAAIGTSCTNPLVTKGNDYYFRVCFIDPFQGNVMANYAYNEVGAKKVAFIIEKTNDYAVGLAKFFEDTFKELTGDENSVVYKAFYNTGDQDFTAQLTSIKESGAEAIFAPGNFTESALVTKQAKELGLDLPILGGDTWETPEFIEIAGEAAEGVVFSTFFDANAKLTDNTTKFLDAYKQKYNKEPAAVTALAFDAYLLAIDAIKKANSTDPTAIRDALAKTKDFPGAAGVVTLDENGDAIKSAVIKTVKDGKFTYLTTVEPVKK
ncbi:ABC transporter substrate-binding protein [Paramaledivibacter caminithermalis]|jgi:branched-chain amino acid transport system substrate-binding protein|uniref:Amino acid/amide ABC transporter substrate-binding protein, HAAT family (TC 3.A.1.4.-) n=1 Tax=Paramaledivibacter caminithermalis (strain DSM 15212 / CIP 107654 / DViRD3) TaxID=1121301 RepID=A0A1M6NXB4_PARC5|nr:ABC transporter substrate-binding protein [Paramaledivibacter caminithermalis]SHK00316.1 amino acid/amide ABC transporter substrate-binding protein, HAAT family (TC 3.A.1.4.-) [Paramaledivibacter caminithermalis DSM 15212]